MPEKQWVDKARFRAPTKRMQRSSWKLALTRMTNDPPGVVQSAATSKQKEAPRTLTTPPKNSQVTQGNFATIAALVALLLGFLVIESFVPMGSAVQIGADEGFELAKATLCLKGHHLYTEVWNDQPPLHTFLVTGILKHISPSVLGPRLLTVGFSVVLLVAVFVIVRQVSGLFVASLTTGMIIASPGFVELSSSCMLEIPALATALAAIAVLFYETPALPGVSWREILAGAVFGLALQMKLVPVIYLPLAALVILIRVRARRHSLKGVIARMAMFIVALAFAYVGSDLLIERGTYLTHFQQSWKSHFGAVKASSEYGSPSEHPFDWGVLWKNWDVTVPAVLGVIVLVRRFREGRENQFRQGDDRLTGGNGENGGDGGKTPGGRLAVEGVALPLMWMALSFGVFGVHKPWWAYYYLHTAIPLCWCAATGIGFFSAWKTERMGRKAAKSECVDRPAAKNRSLGWAVVAGAAGLFASCTIGWMAARVYLQVANLRGAPKIESSPVIAQMRRCQPFVQWMYADKPIYSVHNGIPVVPSLAVMPVKRFWSGELDNAGIRRELEKYRPGLVVLLNDGRDVPFKSLLDAQYQMVYMDPDNRMYALKENARRAIIIRE